MNRHTTDGFPLGRPFGQIDPDPSPPSAHRPWGLRYAATPTYITPLDPADIGYDPVQQIGLIRDQDGWLPAMRHSDGVTGTTTHGDGHKGHDRDTDHRED